MFLEVQRLLLNGIKVTTVHKNGFKWAKTASKVFFCPDKGQSPPKELEDGPRSRPYLLVKYKEGLYFLLNKFFFVFVCNVQGVQCVLYTQPTSTI